MVENLNFAITGHTKGLGLELSKYVKHKGFSRSNNFDISTKNGRERIINEIANCNVFVNCAYCGDFSQVDMLYDVFHEWQNKDSLIINIGSETTSGIKNRIWPYSSHKAALDKASEQLSFLNTKCRVTNFKFGYINSQRVVETINPYEYISIQDAAKFILNNIEIAFQYRLTEILLRP